MQRTRRSVQPFPQPAVEASFSVESALFSPPCGDTIHALFAPLHYASGYGYPLIVWLHGPGSDERQLMRIMPPVSMQNYIAVAPRGLDLGDEASAQGYGWQQTEDHIQQAEQRIFESIATAKRKLHVDPGRVFMAGFDSGGTMAFRVAMNHPQHFAGVVSLCGAFPTGRPPLGNLVAARRLAIFLAAGRDSGQYPAEAVCNDLRLLHSAGMSVTLRQYPCGHDLTPQMLGDVNRWIQELIEAQKRPATDSGCQWSRERE
jgi:phospholipase/carboxylesterase